MFGHGQILGESSPEIMPKMFRPLANPLGLLSGVLCGAEHTKEFELMVWKDFKDWDPTWLIICYPHPFQVPLH